MSKEIEMVFAIGELVKFYVGNEGAYIGEIVDFSVDVDDEVLYDVSSEEHYVFRYAYEIEPYEPYICDDCLLSHILDDVEEGELTANEAREILGLETINEELENYEFKTAGNAYFSIFPDDEHDDAVHIEIDPTWLWTNDDIDELIEQLKLAKKEDVVENFDTDKISLCGFGWYLDI